MVTRNASVRSAVEETARSLSLQSEDAGALQLARRYASAIDSDDPELLEKLGPKLLAVLVELGATPAARKSAKGGASGGVNPVRSAMDELRTRRAARGN